VNPLIGVTVGVRHDRVGRARHAINVVYVSALRAAGGDVVLLPGGQPVPPALLERLDGLLFPGGLDVHPSCYGEEPRQELVGVDADLDAVELPLVRSAVERGTPVFGICRGHQVVNVALGGVLYQDIRGDGLSQVEHMTPLEQGRDFLAHPIAVEAGSRLHGILGTDRLLVNSFHHQAVRRVAPGLQVTATSDDGVIEGMESADGRVLTVQCHPEDLTGHAWARGLFEAFVATAAGARR
jgi:putative glutamine amidotransferase